MSVKVCYITTISSTLDSFCLKSAMYNIEKAGWDITFVSSIDEDFAKRLPSSIKYIPIEIKRGYSISGIKSFFQLYRVFKNGHYDMVEYATTNASFFASFAARLAKVPVRLYGQLGVSYSTFHGFKHFVVETIEKIICKNSTDVYGVSFENLQTAINDGLYDVNKGFVVGYGSSLGVNMERFDISHKEEWKKEIRNKYNVAQEQFVFGYVGRLLKDKGINELFTATRTLANKHDNITVFIVGGLNVIEGIDENLLKWAQTDKHIIFTDYTTEVEKYYAAMDCFVFPSYHEGFGNVTIEAEVMEVPVIVTDIPGSREAMIRDETGITVKVMNVDELEKAMERIYSDKQLREKLIKNSRDFVANRFNEKVMCKQILEKRIELLSKNEDLAV